MSNAFRSEEAAVGNGRKIDLRSAFVGGIVAALAVMALPAVAQRLPVRSSWDSRIPRI
jgi:energy-converting hydrogenase Eha subunit A